MQFKARHGSHWHPTYRAADLKPYREAASAWIEANRDRHAVRMALGWLGGLLHEAGRVEPAQNLKRTPIALRAKVAFARLREAGIKPDRLLAIHLGVAALIEDDRGSHRTDEFRLVQSAKALHRLASGTHGRWETESWKGPVTIRMDIYPRSSGLVLRAMGSALEEAAGEVIRIARDAVIALKQERFGPHPSHLPGWKPFWQRQREARR